MDSLVNVETVTLYLSAEVGVNFLLRKKIMGNMVFQIAKEKPLLNQ